MTWTIEARQLADGSWSGWINGELCATGRTLPAVQRKLGRVLAKLDEGTTSDGEPVPN